MTVSEELFIKVEVLQNMLVSFATNGGADAVEYVALRNELISIPSIRGRLPSFVLTYRDLGQFWAFICSKSTGPSGLWKQRREYLWAEFAPLLQELEGLDGAPADDRISGALKEFDADHVHRTWARALVRRASDPDGAITLARSLLETVCKHILDDAGTFYADSADLPGLYKSASEQLRLAPSQFTERPIKQVLGGATTVVEGIGALRNRASDSHGKGQQSDIPSPQLAELAVNLAGATSLFLVETWQEQQKRNTGPKAEDTS